MPVFIINFAEYGIIGVIINTANVGNTALLKYPAIENVTNVLTTYSLKIWTMIEKSKLTTIADSGENPK